METEWREVRKDLLSACRRAQPVFEQSLAVTARLRDSGRDRLPVEFMRLLNAQDLLLLMLFDVAVLIEDTVSAQSDLRAKVYARTLLLTVYESTKTLRMLLSHEFRTDVTLLLGTTELDQELKVAHSEANRVFRHCEREFRNHRNWLLGHRHHDADVRARLLAEIEPPQMAVLGGEVLSIISNSITAFARATKRMDDQLG